VCTISLAGWGQKPNRLKVKTDCKPREVVTFKQTLRKRKERRADSVGGELALSPNQKQTTKQNKKPYFIPKCTARYYLPV
jgi:hypothetical protein